MATLQDILRSSIDIFTATMYCPSCAEKGRPCGNDEFVTFGGTRKQFVAYPQTRDGVVGYTPHLIFLQQRLSKDSLFYRVCGIVGCGVLLGKDNFQHVICETDRLAHNEFKALRMFKRDHQYEI
jgi:hypothetical protein